MAGCPNRCKHCWIGHTPNKMLTQSDLAYVANEFKDYCNELVVNSWCREPDFRDDYKELWELENELSINSVPQRYELLSFWRLYRDKEYIEWLKGFDIKRYQLTFFGMEDKTDYYTGRKGAFNELIYTTELLLENGLMPRWQVFAYHDNAHEIKELFALSKEMSLTEKCLDLGGEFDIFFHQGSCEGAGRKLYDNRLTSDDLIYIPDEMFKWSKKHYNCNSSEGFLGKPERELIVDLREDDSLIDIVSNSPVFFIDCNFDVYPNTSETSKWFQLGNLKKDGANKSIANYINNTSFAQKTLAKVPIYEMVKLFGDEKSKRLFTKNDYKMYLLNTYCEKSKILF